MAFAIDQRRTTFVCKSPQALIFIISMVKKFGYLGITINYKDFEADTMYRWLETTKFCFHTLKPWLTDKKKYFLAIRLCLYHACVWSTATYAIHKVGLTSKSVKQFVSLYTLCIRQMCHSPSFRTHERIIELFAHLTLTPPWEALRKQNSQLVQRLESHLITLHPNNICHRTPFPPENTFAMPASSTKPQNGLATINACACPEYSCTFQVSSTLK